MRIVTSWRPSKPGEASNGELQSRRLLESSMGRSKKKMVEERISLTQADHRAHEDVEGNKW